jgi:alpha-glucosidase (family GH31 glycosyl hydrolase)
MRSRLEPFLLAYFQEAKDRGFPILRPLPLQYPNDREAGITADAFMLGDELLVAPVMTSANRRRVALPRGNWTDLRTNTRYAGRQTVEVEGPASNPPIFAKNGTIVPFKVTDQLYELHYFPTLAGEFFIFEVEKNQWTQAHAAPNGDYMRMEIESKVTREYEWIIHHVKKPLEIDSKARVISRYDGKLGNLHLRLRAEAGGDEIINIKLPE